MEALEREEKRERERYIQPTLLCRVRSMYPSHEQTDRERAFKRSEQKEP